MHVERLVDVRSKIALSERELALGALGALALVCFQIFYFLGIVDET